MSRSPVARRRESETWQARAQEARWDWRWLWLTPMTRSDRAATSARSGLYTVSASASTEKNYRRLLFKGKLRAQQASIGERKGNLAFADAAEERDESLRWRIKREQNQRSGNVNGEPESHIDKNTVHRKMLLCSYRF